MPTTREVTVYQYAELSDKAKATARDWYRETEHELFDGEYVIEDAERVAALLGIEFKSRTFQTMGGGTRSEPAVYWSLGYSQSDYAAFDAYLAYRKGAVKAVKKYAPQDETLHRIAREWTAAHRIHGYRVTGSVSDRNPRAPDFEWDCLPNGEYPSEEATKAMRACVRDLCRWIYNRLREEYEYQTSDEQVAEGLEANEYEFTADGKPYRY